MRMPRGVRGEELSRLLSKLGYEVTRQTGSHIRLSRRGQHHVTIPRHSELKVGTLSGIVRDIAEHMDMQREEAIRAIWG